jgi:hypothetical protein
MKGIMHEFEELSDHRLLSVQIIERIENKIDIILKYLKKMLLLLLLLMMMEICVVMFCLHV